MVRLSPARVAEAHAPAQSQPGATPSARRALVFWIASAAGSGASAVAARVRALLRDDGIDALALDDGTLSPSALVGLCGAGRSRYDLIVVVARAPKPSASALARDALAPGFYHIDCATDCAEQSQPPVSPDLRIDTGAGRYELATARMMTFIRARLARHPAAAPVGAYAPAPRHGSATLTLRGAAE